MQRRFGNALWRAALWLCAASMLGGCSGQRWYQRSVSQPGVSITYTETIFRDIERILQRCADPIDLQPGMNQVVGIDLLLPGCARAGEVQFDRVTEGVPAARAARLRAAATVMALINEPIDPPVPTRLREVNFDRDNAAELVPILGDEIRKVDVALRASLSTLANSASGIVMLPGAPCTFRGRADIDLTRLKLTNVTFAWRRTGLRMTANVDASEPQALATITTSITGPAAITVYY